jgi:hypothetical protein
LGSRHTAPDRSAPYALGPHRAGFIAYQRLAAQFPSNFGNSFSKDRVLVLIADQGSLQQFNVSGSWIGD